MNKVVPLEVVNLCQNTRKVIHIRRINPGQEGDFYPSDMQKQGVLRSVCKLACTNRDR